MTWPKISLVMPVFDSAATIERALDSIVAQDYPNLEVIFVDGASRDRTAEIAQGYRALFAHFLSEPDRGQTDALNKGFRLATGEIFCWLNGDDALQEGALAHVAELFAAHPEANMVIGTSRRLYADGSEQVLPVAPDVLEKIGYRNGIDQPSAFWRAGLHRAAGELDESYHFSMDWEWWNRLARAGAKAVVTERELSVYYFSDDNKTSSQPQGNVREMHRVMKRNDPNGGELADVYLMLYQRFDLKGCYDNPPTAPQEVLQDWYKTLGQLYLRFGEEVINAYNWNWCSRQERGLG